MVSSCAGTDAKILSIARTAGRGGLEHFTQERCRAVRSSTVADFNFHGDSFLPATDPWGHGTLDSLLPNSIGGGMVWRAFGGRFYDGGLHLCGRFFIY